MLGEVTQHAQAVAVAISESVFTSFPSFRSVALGRVFSCSSPTRPALTCRGTLQVRVFSSVSAPEASAHRVRRSHHVRLAQAVTGRSTTFHGSSLKRLGFPLPGWAWRGRAEIPFRLRCTLLRVFDLGRD